MNDFDKKMRELSKDMKIPETYNRRVEEVLQSIPEEDKASPMKSRVNYKILLSLAVLAICFVGIFSMNKSDVGAGLLEDFKTTILSILNLSEEEQEDLGIESSKMEVVSKPDLLIELKETVIGKQSIYALLEVTAPTDIVFSEQIGFEYFRFCEGENYNQDKMLTGPTECELVEVMEDHPNRAIYVASVLMDDEIAEGSKVTACFQNLTLDPNGESPTLLIEGMWSNSFYFYYTVVDEILLENLEEKEFSYLNAPAYIEKVMITPLGMRVRCDVRNVPLAETAYSQTDFEIRLKIIDGSENVVFSLEDEKRDECLTKTSSTSFDGPQGIEYQQNDYEFRETLDISKIIGMYIEDLYIPVRKNGL